MIPVDSKIPIFLGKITSVLLKETIIEDDETFDNVVSSLAKKFMNFETPKKSNSESFRILTIDRLLSQSTLKEEKLQKLRKRLYQEEQLNITNKPTINSKSKQIVRFI